MWKRLKLWWRAVGDLAQMQGLSDRLLADMGLERDGLRQRVLGREPEPTGPRLPQPSAHLARS
jgi:hypothetical protein